MIILYRLLAFIDIEMDGRIPTVERVTVTGGDRLDFNDIYMCMHGKSMRQDTLLESSC